MNKAAALRQACAKEGMRPSPPPLPSEHKRKDLTTSTKPLTPECRYLLQLASFVYF